ncbi:hypothetical protein SDRG_15392 [Saprolegnia diclina VS20]|uniref:Uncharacterized protein n=1 Tax=Saprolegnia diclina (strain VS20) TaxID=1156394 RepID=T0R430_SAPDV|nr:hypothetical protein SDRG_15392 [Saprolegnia diclina VS20]EQC26803.1 hypothetical protein SDRG_15392 [Saprolegnia diclina VS20]|eukprot:XP_008619785.1 hypothetical protein SDRG_15392 [Saprolegnia diclina VS20]
MRGCLIGRMTIVLGAVILTVILHLLPRYVVAIVAFVLLVIMLIANDGNGPNLSTATSEDDPNALTSYATMLIFLSVTALLICNFVVEDVIPAYVNHLNATA